MGARSGQPQQFGQSGLGQAYGAPQSYAPPQQVNPMQPAPQQVPADQQIRDRIAASGTPTGGFLDQFGGAPKPQPQAIGGAVPQPIGAEATPQAPPFNPGGADDPRLALAQRNIASGSQDPNQWNKPQPGTGGVVKPPLPPQAAQQATVNALRNPQTQQQQNQSRYGGLGTSSAYGGGRRKSFPTSRSF